MSNQNMIESLAAVPAGTEIEVVEHLLADGSRRTNESLSPGARLHCYHNGTAVVLLTSRSGRSLSVSQDVARFVRVRRAGGDR